MISSRVLMPQKKILILPLHQVRCTDEALAGRKAAHLGELSSFLPVPNGFCVTISSFQLFLEYNKIDAISTPNRLTEQRCSQIQAGITNGQWPRSLKKEIIDSYQKLQAPIVVVRSSGLSEDQPEASYAGQLATTLGITTEAALLDAIKTCWASLFAPRVLTYRNTINDRGSLLGAVIVQELVNADFSGVTFTQDPLDSQYLVIETIAGLGQDLVSGTITPSRYIFKRKNLHLQQIKQNNQPQQITMGPQGIRTVPFNQFPTLPKPMVRGIVRKSMQIERHFGSPQDIEWVIVQNRLFFVQTRPISIRPPEQLWTRTFGDEYISGVMSPLFFSWCAELMGTDVVKQQQGYLFVTTSFLQNFFNIQHLPRFCRHSLIRNNFPLCMQEELSNLPYAPQQKLFLEFVKLLASPDVLFFTTPQAYQQFEKRYRRYIAEFDKQLASASTPQDLLTLYSQLNTMFAPHLKLSFAGVGHCLTLTSWLEGLLERWLHDSSFLYTLLTETSNRTTETNTALASLAQQVQQGRNLTELFTDETGYILQHLPQSPSFSQDFGQFLTDYGHRSFTRDPLYPRWNEQPSLVIDNIKNITKKSRTDLEENTLSSPSQQEAIQRLKKLTIGKYLLVKIFLSYTVKYINFRENERFILDLHISRMRALYLAMGQMLVERKKLKKKEDIFYLSIGTVRSLLTGENQDVLKQISQIKQEYKKNLETIPPKFLRGDSALDDFQPELVGTPASSGIIKGKARVIAAIDEFPTLQANEILITRIIDPGMTPYFSTIAGVITEIGGVLCHGAILAREYHIPAVTGVHGALDKISTGDEVTIDGDTGRIYVKKK